MTGLSAINEPVAVRKTPSVQLLSLREGCVAIRRNLDEIPPSGTENAFREKASGCLRCIEHEASMIEELPHDFFGKEPCQRIIDLCRGAAGLLTREAEPTATLKGLPGRAKLCTAFLSLIPKYLEDYQRARHVRIRLQCGGGMTMATPSMPGSDG